MIKGPTIECEKCNKQYEIDADEFVKSEDPSEEEEKDTDMGPKIYHAWQYEHGCKFCDNTILVEIGGSEYPIGDPIDYDKCFSEGCRIIIEPKME